MSLSLSLDIGHSSIGWAVLQPNDGPAVPPNLLGCGVLLFEKDSALASQRRLHRQQRRHVRATKTRIHRLEQLLTHLGALTPAELASRHAPGTGHPAPWQLAARVLASDGKSLLNWPELWAVLRWYAHNRGYEPWGETDASDSEAIADNEKVSRAEEARRTFGTTSMAETVCRWLGVDPHGPAKLSHEPAKNLRQQKAAFPRDIVRAEVRTLLSHHVGKLAGLDDTFIRTLMDEARATKIPGLVLPRRYRGGLLFGRLQMRYDTRIIACCVHTAAARHAELRAQGVPEVEARRLAERDAKVPSKKSPEFLRYRWAMLLANLRIATGDDPQLRPLNVAERATLHARMSADGRLTKTELRDAVRALPGRQRDNFDNLFLHPDAERALVLDPAQALIQENPHLRAVWPVLPEKLRARTRNRWWRINPANGKAHTTTLAALREELPRYGGDVAAFDAALASASPAAPAKAKSSSKKPAATVDPLTQPLHLGKALAALSGRAPYARPLLAQAFDEVIAGRDPKASGGCLEETERVNAYREGRPFDQQTNNHLLRHRLLILGRLLRDLVADPVYGVGDATRFSRVTIEVNRELRDWASKERTEIVDEEKRRLQSHKDAVAWLNAAGVGTGGTMIRKARVALDLGCRCPYTDVEYEAVSLRDELVDLDHIIPRSLRPSDALDSLAITFRAVNLWKNKRTAWQFIQDCGGQTVPGAPHLSIVTSRRFKEIVRKLDTKGHDDDRRRKSRRKEFFLLESYTEKERDFTPGQLTQTSQLTRLARIAVRRSLPHLADHDLVALPGSVTGAVRKAWRLMDCLATVCPAVLDADGKMLREKSEIRGITHLHHAVDAITLGYASALLPHNGALLARLVALLQQRKIAAADRDWLRSQVPVNVDADGKWRLRSLLENHPALDKQIRARLSERRVVQHVPADMSGLRLEENTRRVLESAEGRVKLRQRAPRDAEGNRPTAKITNEPTAKAFGLVGGKLAALKGVRVVTDNFGVAILDDATLPPEERFIIVPHRQVWRSLAELKARNGGKAPQLWRNGQIVVLPSGARAGLWRIFSIKNSSEKGLVLDLGQVDSLKATWREVILRSLLRDGATKSAASLLGAVAEK